MINLSPFLVHKSHKNNSIICRELVLITPGIDNIHELITDLPSTSKVVILNADTDSIEQITALLEEHTYLSSLHIVSHGASGCLYLGNTELNFATLDKYSDRIRSWARVLEGKDIFIYGCHVAQGAMGHLFLQQLHQLTGANIAASRERVGKSNWNLDAKIGKINSSIVFSRQLQKNYQGSFEPFVSFSVSTDTLIESERTPFSFNFSLSEPPPPEGVKVRLEGSIPQAINQWNLVLLSFTGLADVPADISPAQDFSAFEVTIISQNGSLNLPIFNDNEDDSPQTITWTISPISGASVNPSANSATVTIFDDASEAPSNTAPVADNDNYSTDVDTQLIVSAENGVLNGDTDEEQNALVARLVVPPSNGNLTLNEDGSFVYTPNPGFSGSDRFTYTANDGRTDSNTATVNIGIGENPVGSLSATTTSLVEDQNAVLALTVNLSEVPPPGGINITIDSETAQSLGEFDVDSATFDGASLVSINDDSSGFIINVTGQTATINLPVLNDGTNEGTENITYTLQPGSGYQINPAATSVEITIADNITAEDNPVTITFEASSSGEISSFFYDLTAAGDGEVNVALTDDVLALGTEAKFDNLVGFYEVADTNGGIDTNGDGIADIFPGDAGYAQAALSGSIDGLTIRAGSDGDGSRNTTANELSNTVITGGKLYAPFAIANGGALTPQEYLQINPDNEAAQSPEQQVAYFAFVGANPDGAVHLKSLGNDIFGFEDLPANLGSDNDFNDAAFRFNFS